ncbi:MAG: hypothetical protein ACRCZN_13450 [Lactococcus lactis]
MALATGKTGEQVRFLNFPYCVCRNLKKQKGEKVKKKEYIDHALSSSLLSIILWCAWLSWQLKILLFISLVITIFSIIYWCGVAIAKKKKLFKK